MNQTTIAPAPRDFSAVPRALRGRIARTRARLRRWRLHAILWLGARGPRLRRVVDVVVCGIGLVFASPILLAAAIAVKSTSRGPAFYRQERVGLHGRSFLVIKLRTMVSGADAMKSMLAARRPSAVDGVRFKIRNDPRITPVGRLLRRYSIDELPQLWNVVRGDMTLLGPRPPVPREVALYDARALRRLEVPPGLTCLWQVQGRSDLSFAQQIDLDLEYIDRVRPLEELWIVAKTIPAVLSGRGAY